VTGLPDDRDPSGRFVRGLTLGALLGAVIAGSSIWTRARARRRQEARAVVVAAPAIPEERVGGPAQPTSAEPASVAPAEVDG